MTFCSNCGKQHEGSGRFCVYCGADTLTTAGSGASPAITIPAPAAAAMPAAVPVANNVQPFPPVQYAPLPPPPATQNRGGMMGTLVVLAAVAAGGYYYYAHGKTPTPAPAPSPAPTDSKALVQQQSFNAQWQDKDGMLVLTSAKWTNSANVTLSSATVQCEQYNAVGTDLSQYRVTLNGPTEPNTASTYSNVQMGAVASGMSKVNCDVVHVKTGQ